MEGKPKRRWRQFSLQTLFIAMTVCAVLALTIPTTVVWFFPPKPKADFDSDVSLIISGGQMIVEPQETNEGHNDKSGGGFF